MTRKKGRGGFTGRNNKKIQQLETWVKGGYGIRGQIQKKERQNPYYADPTLSFKKNSFFDQKRGGGTIDIDGIKRTLQKIKLCF